MGQMVFEILTNTCIDDLLNEIVNESNREVIKSKEKYKKLPDVSKAMLSMIYFTFKRKPKANGYNYKYHLIVHLPYSVNKINSFFLDKFFGFTAKLKKLFKDLNIDASVKKL